MAKMTKEDYKRMLTSKGKKKYERRPPPSTRGGRNIDMDRIKKHLPYFVALLKYVKNKKQKNALIDEMTNSQLKTVKHMVQCFLNHKIQVPEKDLKSMKRDKSYLYGLVRNDVAPYLKKKIIKKKIVKQKGGFLGALIGAIAPAVIGPVVKGLGKIFG